MNKILIVIFTTFLSLASLVSLANDAHHPSKEIQKSYSARGEVVALDIELNKVKLKHEPVPALNWPSMTMYFKVADKSLLDTVKVGDQVDFEFVKVEGESPLIINIKPVD